jgi:uncharacterized protein YcfJ
MHIQSSFRRIHPLVAVASVALIIFSLLGIAAITGVLPTSHGSLADAHNSMTEPPIPVAASVSPNATPIQPGGPIKHTHTNAQQVATGNAPAHPATQQAATKPVPQNSPVGIGVGAVVGGVLGSQVGSGDGKTLATILGAIGGGYVGNEVAKKNQ